MSRAEIEFAAAILVLACQKVGDWLPRSRRELGEAIGWALETKREPWVSLNRNPFFRPDFTSFVDSRFAQVSGDEGERVAFTPEGLLAIRRHTRQAYVERVLSWLESEWDRLLEEAA